MDIFQKCPTFSINPHFSQQLVEGVPEFREADRRPIPASSALEPTPPTPTPNLPMLV